MAGAEADLRASTALDRQEGKAWEAVTAAADALAEAVGTWRLIESGDLHWDTAYPHLLAEAGECAGYDLALQMAGEETEAARTALDRAVSGHCNGKTTSTGDTA